MPRNRDAAPTIVYLTVEDVARALQCHPKTVRRWIKAGALKAIRLNRQYRVHRANLDTYIAANTCA